MKKTGMVLLVLGLLLLGVCGWSETISIGVVEFEVSEFNDFCIDMSKSRSVLGLNPEYDICRIVDDAVEFRKAGGQRSECLYPG